MGTDGNVVMPSIVREGRELLEQHYGEFHVPRFVLFPSLLLSIPYLFE